MYQLKSLGDTIVAISTPLGQGGIGIVRLSGREALAIADGIFFAKNGKKPSAFKSFTVHYGDIVRDGEIIDEALLTVMRAPGSYTKEDVVEISCHGGAASLKMILEIAVGLGARLAEPGEFTKRAFLNGRIDLTQAEAVLDIIQAKTEAFLKISTCQLKGELSTELEKIRGMLMDIYVEMEAAVNFPEDDMDDVETRHGASLQDRVDVAKQRVEQLLVSGEHGRILKEGIKIVICGKPNVGKSSLLNVFLKQPRAIVSPVAGTTRDTIEETAQIGGIPFQLVDTAGLLDPRDVIEEEAVKRSHLSIEAADLVLFLLDVSSEIGEEDRKVFERVKVRDTLIILNKCDLKIKVGEKETADAFPGTEALAVSTLSKEGMGRLQERIVEKVWHGKTIDTGGVLLSNVRHIGALREALAAVTRAGQALRDGLSLEFVSEEIKGAVNFLDSITGRNIDTDLLETIFSQFCIGK